MVFISFFSSDVEYFQDFVIVFSSPFDFRFFIVISVLVIIFADADAVVANGTIGLHIMDVYTLFYDVHSA